MPKDHYVAQTYLSNFTNKSGRLVPYYKNGRVIAGKSVAPKSVCCKENGSSTKFLEESRALEYFLKPIESAWNANLTQMKERVHTAEIRRDVSSYLACLRVCTPTHVRKGQAQYASTTEISAKILSKQGVFYNEEFSPEFNAEMRKMIENGGVEYQIDPEFILATSIQAIPRLIRMLWNADWKILFDDASKFVTSDNPLCLYYPGNNPQFAWWYAPLTPEMALIIKPNIDLEAGALERNDLPGGAIEYGKVKPAFRDEFNENLVRSAEQAVFFHSKQAWLETIVQENKAWRSEMIVDVLPSMDGYLSIHRDRVRESIA